MEKRKPKYYIETRFEKIEKFSLTDIREYYFSQPVKYCNDICYWDYAEDSYEISNWGYLESESYLYNSILKICRYDDNYWMATEIKDTAFEIIFNSDAIKEKIYRGSCTELKMFEIYLLNNGYEISYFGMLNAFCPNRSYEHKKTGKKIFLGFGAKHKYLEFMFYFICSDDPNGFMYQVPIKEEDFEKAVNMQLESFEEKLSKILSEKRK